MSTDRACPTAAGATVGRRRARSQGGASEDPRELAVEIFNGSDAVRLVGGLMRTLGDPRVSVGAASGSPSEMRVTVAWELTWYQWRIDLERGPRGVAMRAKGREIAELDGAARVWNGGAAPGGALHIGRTPRQPARRRRRLW